MGMGSLLLLQEVIAICSLAGMVEGNLESKNEDIFYTVTVTSRCSAPFFSIHRIHLPFES